MAAGNSHRVPKGYRLFDLVISQLFGNRTYANHISSWAIKARYIHGVGLDEPVLMVRGGKFTYLHPDGLGSIVAATDSRGVLAESYSYRAFGEPTIRDAQGRELVHSRVGNPFLFTGRELDSETGLGDSRDVSKRDTSFPAKEG